MSDSPPPAVASSFAPQPSVGPVHVYRSALADIRGKLLAGALILWSILQGGVFVLHHYFNAVLVGLGKDQFSPPPTQVWFSPFDLQIGIAQLQSLSGSLLQSIACQIAASLLFITALLSVFTQRLRILAIIIPTTLFILAAAFHSLAYNLFRPYIFQPTPVFTLGLMLLCLAITCIYAPRNTTLRDFFRMTRTFARDALRNPVAMLCGPIFEKEVRVLGRRRGTFIVRSLYCLLLLGAAATIYISGIASLDENASGIDRVQHIQEISPLITVFLAWIQYLVLLFLAASSTSGSICDERRTRTLATLMTTPMNATQIVMGKLTSRLAQLLIVGLISVPFLMSIRIFGGVDAESIIAITAITVSSTFLMAAVGILGSVLNRKSSSAVAFAIVMFLCITLGPLILIAISMPGGPPSDNIFAISAPAALGIISASISGENSIGINIQDLWILNTSINTVVGIILVFIAAVTLRAIMLSETALEAPKKKIRRAKRKAPSIPPSTDPASTPPTESAAATEPTPAPEREEVILDRRSIVSDNPVLWRELRQPVFGSRRKTLCILAVIIALLVWLHSRNDYDPQTPYMLVSILGMLFLALQAAVVSPPTIVNERDSSTWSTLLTTPLTPREILFPKLIGAVRKLWLVATLILGHLFFGVLTGDVHFIVILHLALIIAGAGFFLGGTGILFAALSRKSNTPGLLNILLAISLWAITPMIIMMVTEILFTTVGSYARGNVLQDFMLYINPVAMTAIAVAGAIRPQRALSYDFPTGDIGPESFTIITVIASLAGIAVGYACFAIATRQFNVLNGRTS